MTASTRARFGFALVLLLFVPALAQESTTPEDASRFLAHATLGADWDEIHRTAGMGLEAWLEEQFQAPIGYHQPFIDEKINLGQEVNSNDRRHAWWERVMTAPDPLRQRVAFALSEHFVISDRVDAVGSNPQGAANYYDMLLEHSFGNFHDLLRDVSLHPVMGVYLSHLRNRKSDPTRGLFPDENYAREIMQLFSIGLHELRIDGTLLLDGEGELIPTYTNDDITEFAKIFTGLSYASADGTFSGSPNWTRSMRMYPDFHEPGPKYLLRGTYIPPGQTGMQDVEDAIANLFHHPNVGPFFARRLIQRLTSSNPSPGYIQRVAQAFNDDGTGVRGDMPAVIRAVLLDPEVRDAPTSGQVTRGRLRESYLRRVHLALAFEASSPSGTFPISDFNAPNDFGQRPLSSPTVFNFFLPDHQPSGDLADNDLYGPEFQIINTVTAISSANALRTQIDNRMNGADSPLFEVELDLSEEIAMAGSASSLLNRLDLLLMYGSMSPRMREILTEAIQQIEDPEERTKMAIFLISISPEYSVIQ